MPQAGGELQDPGVQVCLKSREVMEDPKSPSWDVWLLDSSLELMA